MGQWCNPLTSQPEPARTVRRSGFDHGGGGGSSIVKVPGDVPPARVCFFKSSSLAKGILFANFSPFSLAKGILFANFRPVSLGKGILFGNFGQRNVKLL